MKEMLNRFIRAQYGSFINDDDNLSSTDVLNENWSYTDRKINECFICIFKKHIDDDFVTKEIFQKYKSRLDFLSNDHDYDLCYNCSKLSLSLNFISSVGMFIYSLNNLDYIVGGLDKRDKKILLDVFLKGFYLNNGIWSSDFTEFHKYYMDYLLEYFNDSLQTQSCYENIKELHQAKDFLNYTMLRIKNMEETPDVGNMDCFSFFLNFINSKLEYYEKIYALEIELQTTERSATNDEDKSLQPLKDLWLPNAKISLEEVIKIGIEKGIWDKNRNIITSRASLYGTGKSLLASLSVALKNQCYSDSIHPDFLGSAFCQAFNINIDLKVDRPYKSFGSPNTILIKRLKYAFLKM